MAGPAAGRVTGDEVFARCRSIGFIDDFIDIALNGFRLDRDNRIPSNSLVNEVRDICENQAAVHPVDCATYSFP